MDLRQFLATPSLWNRQIPGVHRSTRHRLSTAATSPTLDTIELIVGTSGYRTEVTTSTLTPLPLPALSASTPVIDAHAPIFENFRGQLRGDFKGNAIYHHTGTGGTTLLSAMALIAHGFGWETWLVDPKGFDRFLLFPRVDKSATEPEDIASLFRTATTRLNDTATRPGPPLRPLLITVDVTDYVLNTDPELATSLQLLIDHGSQAGIHINLGAKALPITGLREIRLPVGDYSTAIVDNEPCRRPRLFTDFTRTQGADTTDIDYRRFLANAE